jgi:hypothetical protein
MEMINGFQCKTCTDVDYAKKHIDPAHPKDGPYGVNAKPDAGQAPADPIRFGGALAGLQLPQAAPSGQRDLSDNRTGVQLDLRI